jgi:hypothetical protein
MNRELKPAVLLLEMLTILAGTTIVMLAVMKIFDMF